MKQTCLDCGLVNVCSGWQRNTPKRCQNYFREVTYKDLILMVGRYQARRALLSKHEDIRVEIIEKLIFQNNLRNHFIFISQGNAIYYRPKSFEDDFKKFKDLFIEEKNAYGKDKL